MAGMLPGVELAKRRRMLPHRQEEAPPCRSRRFTTPGDLPETPTPLDETALRARHRLDQKLGSFYSPSSSILQEKSRGSHHSGRTKETWLSSKILRGWQFKRNILSSKLVGRQVCAVCLEGLAEAELQLMSLPCSHKFHSKCLLPWLIAHPHCPCCRSHIET